MVGIGEFPCFPGRSNVKTHLGDVITSRKFNRRPYSALKVDLVVFEVVACSEFVGLVDAKPKGYVNRSMGVSSDGTFDVNRKWRRKPSAFNLTE